MTIIRLLELKSDLNRDFAGTDVSIPVTTIYIDSRFDGSYLTPGGGGAYYTHSFMEDDMSSLGEAP
jgi:hypothetical protein